MGYRSVVVGTDGSASAEIAVRHAAALAAAFGARLTIVSAFADRGDAEVARSGSAAPGDLTWALTDAGQAEDRVVTARAIARDAGVVGVASRVERGDPADAIVQVAGDIGADLIVVGNKGMTSAARFVAGNVPNKVSHHAPCDLIIVATT